MLAASRGLVSCAGPQHPLAKSKSLFSPAVKADEQQGPLQGHAAAYPRVSAQCEVLGDLYCISAPVGSNKKSFVFVSCLNFNEIMFLPVLYSGD